LTGSLFLSKFHAHAGIARCFFNNGLAEFVPREGSTMIRKFVFVLLAISSVAFTLPADPPNYHLVKRADVGGRGGWDYLTYDEGGHRVFVSRGNLVIVLDGESGAQVGEIPDTPGVHGIALAPDFGRGFTSNGRTNNVTIFDLKTLRTIGHVSTGKGPDAIVYDPASKRVFTMNGRDNTATAIDAESGTVAGTVPLSGRPEFAAADGRGTVFVNIENKNTLTAIDSKQLTVKSNWDMPGCDGPTGLSMDREHRRTFSGCDKVMAVMDADSGKLVANLPIGAGVDATAFAPKSSLAFSSNGEDGTLTVIHEDSPDKFTVVANVPTEEGARTMALDPDSGTVYLVSAPGRVKLILSFIFGVFGFVLRPALGLVGAIFLIAALVLLLRARGHGWTTKRQWSLGICAFLGVILIAWCGMYDSVLMALSPTDFHMTIWSNLGVS
jgi:DNA-binding beta-propeller fold protein YncE